MNGVMVMSIASKYTNGNVGPRAEPRYFDDRGKPIPMTDERRREWIEAGDRALAGLADIVDETDTEERWDEALRNLGVDPRTGRGLGS